MRGLPRTYAGMSTFNEADHPRASTGQFTDKPQSPPELSLTPQAATAIPVTDELIDALPDGSVAYIRRRVVLDSQVRRELAKWLLARHGSGWASPGDGHYWGADGQPVKFEPEDVSAAGVRSGDIVDLQTNRDDGPFGFAFRHAPGAVSRFKAWKAAGAGHYAVVDEVRRVKDEPSDVELVLRFGDALVPFPVHREATVSITSRA